MEGYGSEALQEDAFGESRYYITSEHMKAFRIRLKEELRDTNTPYNTSDKKLLDDDDTLVWRYIVHNRLDLERGVKMAVTTLKWRRDMEVNTITESSLSKMHFRLGFLYPLNLDRYSNHVLVFQMRNFSREGGTQQDIKRFIIFFLETLFTKYNANRISVLLDFGGCQSGQIDYRILNFFFSLFRLYYPRSLGFTLLWRAPRLLQFSWSLFKPLLPIEAIERVRFVDGSNIHKYIDPANLPLRMGGQEMYRYEYDFGHPMGERCPKLEPLDTSGSSTTSANVYGLFTA